MPAYILNNGLSMLCPQPTLVSITSSNSLRFMCNSQTENAFALRSPPWKRGRLIVVFGRRWSRTLKMDLCRLLCTSYVLWCAICDLWRILILQLEQRSYSSIGYFHLVLRADLSKTLVLLCLMNIGTSSQTQLSISYLFDRVGFIYYLINWRFLIYLYFSYFPF